MIVLLTRKDPLEWQALAATAAAFLLFAVMTAQAQVQQQAPAVPPGQHPAVSQSASNPEAPVASQSASSPEAATPATPPAAVPDTTKIDALNPFRPGLLQELGRMLENSVNSLNSNLKGGSATFGNLGNQTNEMVKGAADAAKDAANLTAGAAGNIVALPANRVVDGRARCEAAPNGAPDCRVAANVLCRRKGFEQGSSLEVQSAEKCSAQIWLSGRPRKPGECDVETYVIRAACR